ncbi:MAG: Mur ligase family protein [Evtepia sp.]
MKTPCASPAPTAKTTTTSMCTHIVHGRPASDPTVMIGGTLPILGTGHRVGKGKTIILESCEYCNSFLSFFPTVAVILNIEADHLDFFKDLDDVEHSFRALRRPGARESGVVLANRRRREHHGGPEGQGGTF